MMAALHSRLAAFAASDGKQITSVLLTLALWCVIMLAALPMLWPILRPRLRGLLPSERRALALMRGMLTPHELRQLNWLGYLDVPSPSIGQRVYRVPRGQGMVQVLEGGRAVMRLCLQPTIRLPDADIVVMHKLMIEANEADYFAQANKFPAGPGI
ncbi:MAG TPA: hypothetical protein VGR57_19450 [Ktedonobacterales bacterium]|nr:hypothetical protein [Ktedonobacterales bacterium]